MHVLRNLAPESKILKYYGGYDPVYFFPAENISKSSADSKLLNHEIVFTGGSYSGLSEGAFRAGILGQLVTDGYKVSIWGDAGWREWFRYYPELESSFKGQRLEYKELRSLLLNSKIYLNMPSPQIAYSFQPRVFEIAASKGFQIILHSDELRQFFDLDKIATFHSYCELKEKLNFYLSNPEERQIIVDYMYQETVNKRTFKAEIERLAKAMKII